MIISADTHSLSSSISEISFSVETTTGKVGAAVGGGVDLFVGPAVGVFVGD